jgi:hypothetical protein
MDYRIYPNTRRAFFFTFLYLKTSRGVFLNSLTKKNTPAESMLLHRIAHATICAFCEWEALYRVSFRLCMRNNRGCYKLGFVNCTRATVSFSFCVREAESLVSLIIYSGMHTAWLLECLLVDFKIAVLKVLKHHSEFTTGRNDR